MRGCQSWGTETAKLGVGLRNSRQEQERGQTARKGKLNKAKVDKRLEHKKSRGAPSFQI